MRRMHANRDTPKASRAPAGLQKKIGRVVAIRGGNDMRPTIVLAASERVPKLFVEYVKQINPLDEARLIEEKIEPPKKKVRASV